jgi:Ca2+-binding RTX toxin-like protein
MPITRTRIEGGLPDAYGNPPYLVVGTEGPDSYVTQPGDFRVRMWGGNDNVRVEGAYYYDLGHPYVEISLGAGRDTGQASGVGLYGDGGNDTLRVGGAGNEAGWAVGGPGNDILVSTGGDGNRLHGEAGNDQLHSGQGRDHLFGGRGVDRFYLHADGEDTVHFLKGDTGVKPNRDVIFHFEAAPDKAGEQDRIDLSAIDANPSIVGDQAFAWIGHNTGTTQIGVGQAVWFQEGDNAVVAWNDGIRQAVVLDGLAEQAGQLDARDFWL